MTNLETTLDVFQDHLTKLHKRLIAESPPGVLNLFQQLVNSSSDLTQHIEQLQGLTRTAALLTSSLKLHDVLEQVIDTIVHLTGAERGYVMLYDPKQAAYHIKAARNWDQTQLPDDDLQISSTIVEYVMQHREAVVVLNAQDDMRFKHASSVHAKALRSVLCLPLEVRSDIIGVLYADNRVTRGIFRESLLPIMTAYAHQVAIAIDNAQLYEQLQGDLDASRREITRLKVEAANQQLADPLSERELAILGLITLGASNQEIADQLVVEMSTVKKHINHIYSKLGVETRAQAMVKAHDLHLV
jgi:GAF domain-containing protein